MYNVPFIHDGISNMQFCFNNANYVPSKIKFMKCYREGNESNCLYHEGGRKIKETELAWIMGD